MRVREETMQGEANALSERRRKTGNVLIAACGIMLLGSATTKLAQVAPVVAQMNANGFAGVRLEIVAILEAISGVLFLIPATRAAGLLWASAFMGGAIATHMGHSQPIAGPVIVLSLLWLSAWLRHPEILWSLRREKSHTVGRLTPAGGDSLLRQL
jgi:hypothetical protein